MTRYCYESEREFLSREENEILKNQLKYKEENKTLLKIGLGLACVVGLFIYGGLKLAPSKPAGNPAGNLQSRVVQPVDVDYVNRPKIVKDADYSHICEKKLKIENKIIDYKTRDFSKDSDKVLLARMLYGEARNCPREEKIEIAYTAINRANDGKKWNGETIKEAILKPWQYSCFNKDDVNYEKLKNPKRKIFEECLKIANEVLDGKYKELNRGQTHYHTRAVHPSWADSDQMTHLNMGNTKHEFYMER
ncbi:MAG: cell wall hydrolase [Candidatus Nanoarchaeia archaeon]|nr:cell wall hydrolase [Candidatus Nanoarchaeia archaeon]MDD5741584.1 cell wall hydrolase [Candidatus Nanoarchaeia archaeon]